MIFLTSELKLKICFPKFLTEMYFQNIFTLVFSPALMGHPMGSTRQKQHTTVVDPKFIPNMPADFLQIKVTIKRTLNLWHSSQYHVCKIPYLTPLPLPLPSFGFFLLSLMVFTTRERCEMVHGFMVAYHFSNVQSYFLLLTFSIFSFKPTIFATCGRCEMIHELLSHGGISFQH